MAKVFLIPIQYIKDNTVIDDNVDDKMIRVAIIDAQELMLESVLGTPLYNKLIHDTTNAVLTANYQELLVGKVWPYLLQAVQWKIVMNLIYRLTNSSVVKDSNAISTAVSLQELNVIRQEREVAIKYHEDKLQKYLLYNMNLFPEYKDIDLTGNAAQESVMPQNFYADVNDLTIDDLRKAGFHFNL